MVYALNRSVYLLIVIAVLIDLTLWGLMHAPVGCCAQALLYTLIGAQGPLVAIALVGFVALWTRFILTGTLGVDLLLMVPLGAGYYYAGSVADIPRPVMALAVGTGVVLQRVVFYGSVDLVGVLVPYISAGIMVYLITGSQGNRLRK